MTDDAPTAVDHRAGKRNDIQGMRAVAVLLVVLSHAGVTQLEGGYIGVDVFFVLSGFLITGILLRQARGDGGISIAGFYANRAKRILPIAVVVIVTTMYFANRWLAPARVLDELDNAVYATFFGANWNLAYGNTDYFAQDQPASAFQHFWSLAVEEQFYLVWPLLISLAFLGLHHRSGSRTRVVLGLLGAVTAGSLAWSILQTDSNPEFAYFSTFTRAWELGLGGLLAVVAPRLRATMPSILGALLSWFGLAAIVVSAFLFTEETAIPGYAAALPVLGTVAVLGGGLVPSKIGASALLSMPPLRWIGDISYSLYLWHWPMLILAPAAIGRDLTLSENLGLMVGAIALSAVTYFFIENPVRNSQHLTDSPRDALLIWPSAIAAVLIPVVILQSGVRVDALQASARDSADYDQGLAELQTGANAPEGPVQEAVAAAKAGLPVPSFKPSVERLAGDNVYVPAECRNGVDGFSKRICELGVEGGDQSIVVVGDSTAAMWMPAMIEAAKDNGWSLKPIIKYECPGINEMHTRDGESLTQCTDWRAWAQQAAADLKPDLIIVSGYTTLDNLVTPTSQPIPTGRPAEAVWESGTQTAVEKLASTGSKVVVLGMQPRSNVEPLDCLGTGATLEECSYPVDGLSTAVNEAEQRGARAAGGEFAEWSDLQCFDRLCPMVIDGIATIYDNHHTTATYSSSVSDQVEDKLAGLLGAASSS